MTESSPRILIADDQPDVLKALKVLLKGDGYRTTLVTSPAEVMEALSGSGVVGGSYDAVLIDLNYTRDTTSGRLINAPGAAFDEHRCWYNSGGKVNTGRSYSWHCATNSQGCGHLVFLLNHLISKRL